MLPSGEPCQRKLASNIGGLYVLAEHRFAAIVSGVQAVRCPDCETDNLVTPTLSNPAVVIEYGSTVSSQAAS